MLLRLSCCYYIHQVPPPTEAGTRAPSELTNRVPSVRGSGTYVLAARNDTDGQECARRTVAVARDKCAPPEPRARTTRIIILYIIVEKNSERRAAAAVSPE